mmetsp:Transcript_67943/g.124022  ORF Transcript_67943/g.124022 Transcript_67943/m.124022 type:complete len:86 (-) Transcript_67943:323-580(-)
MISPSGLQTNAPGPQGCREAPEEPLGAKKSSKHAWNQRAQNDGQSNTVFIFAFKPTPTSPSQSEHNTRRLICEHLGVRSIEKGAK